MKRIVLIVALLTNIITMSAKPNPEISMTHGASRIDKIEPANWFAGMKNPVVQLMVYGKDIAKVQKVTTDYPGAVVDSILRLDSPNYLLVYMSLNAAQPGTMTLCFDNKKYHTN